MGGWPLIEGNNWKGDQNFSWMEANYLNHKMGYSVGYLFDLFVANDAKNSSLRMIWVSLVFEDFDLAKTRRWNTQIK